MRPFDYLSILVSIIVALGITALLSNAARYVRVRDEIVGYAPVAVWALTLFLLLVQIWWVSFYRRDIASFTFFGFVLYLAIPDSSRSSATWWSATSRPGRMSSTISRGSAPGFLDCWRWRFSSVS